MSNKIEHIGKIATKYLRYKYAEHKEKENDSFYHIPFEGTEHTVLISGEQLIGDAALLSYLLSELATVKLPDIEELNNALLIDLGLQSATLKRLQLYELHTAEYLVETFISGKTERLSAMRNVAEVSIKDMLKCVIDAGLPVYAVHPAYDVMLVEILGAQRAVDLGMTQERAEKAVAYINRPKRDNQYTRAKKAINSSHQSGKESQETGSDEDTDFSLWNWLQNLFK